VAYLVLPDKHLPSVATLLTSAVKSLGMHALGYLVPQRLVPLDIIESVLELGVQGQEAVCLLDLPVLDLGQHTARWFSHVIFLVAKSGIARENKSPYLGGRLCGRRGCGEGGRG
jgi:hypothetical protein